MSSVVADLRTGATLDAVDAADQAFHVPSRSGRKDVEVRSEIVDVLAQWISRLPEAGTLAD